MIHFEIDKKKAQLKDIEHLMSLDSFWNEQKRARRFIQISNNLKSIIENYQNLMTHISNFKDELDLLKEEYSEEMHELIEGDYSLLSKEIASFEKLNIGGMFTHFARADELSEEGDAFTRLQFERFINFDSALKAEGIDVGFRHACNSAGAIRFPEYALDGVRFGISLYGGGSHVTELSPVMRLESEITYVHTLCVGESVGYGGRFVADRERHIATLSIGYGDGLLRRFSGGKVLLITKGGRYECPVVGNICMDQCMIDVTDTDAQAGDRVILFGDEPKRLAEFARRVGTIDYECLCQVSSRVPRIAE